MEAADSPSTSSKVIVQCTDPHNLFEKILPDLQSRQKLGNLHWKSSSRPLRSIDRLDVSFIREEKADESSNSTRRHQIPGLRQTPFVKVLLLRCDDRETYKETTRKDVKQWLKGQGLSIDGKSSTRGQERHDAFEYIILHVVLPNTAAAAQPKSSKHISVDANESTDSVNSKAKWPGKGSSTIYEKLRADFSSSSKVPFERIAQVRVLDPDTRPTSILSPAENADLWQDFVEKLKIAILASFDMRVAQYEDDIKDRDSQRNLPGWNFCTFFILKEGLARGFENVGLLEDAMIVYDELDAGLDHVVEGQAVQGDADAASALLPFSDALKPAIRSALDTLQDNRHDSNGTSPKKPNLNKLLEIERAHFPFDIMKLDYQQRILTNKVSALDLRLYLFTRKLHLLFRKARITAAPSKSKSVDDQWKRVHDVGSIADITEKTLSFIAFGARALHQDLYAAWGGYEGLSEEEGTTQKHVIGNLVASWKFSALMQVVYDCHIMLLLPLEVASIEDSGAYSNGKKDDNSILRNAEQQMSADQTSTPPTMNGQQSATDTLEYRQSTMISLKQSSQPQQNDVRTDARECLALWTAELFVKARNILRDTNPAAIGLKGTTQSPSTASRIDQDRQAVLDTNKRIMAGLQSPTLRLGFSQTEVCAELFRVFTTYAYQCYCIARQTQASRQMLLSLAEIEIYENRPDRAAQWLQHIPAISTLGVRTITDFSVLAIYVQSLEQLDQPDEYAKSLLSVFAAYSSDLGALAFNNAGIDVQRFLDEFARASKEVEPCEMVFGQLFALHNSDESIHHVAGKDGVAITLSLYLQIPASLNLEQEIMLSMTAVQNNEPKNIVLRSQTEVCLTSKTIDIVFASNVSTLGWYNFDFLLIKIGNITFRYDFSSADIASGARKYLPPTYPPIMLYPRAGALSIQASPAPRINLTEASRIRVAISVGDSNIRTVLLRTKPCTAGVRLNIQAVELQDGQGAGGFEIAHTDRNVAVEIRNLTKDHIVVLDIPYTTEQNLLKVVEVKFEVSYTNEQGTFESFFTESIRSVLPITVNVQDIFQIGGLYSKFTAGPATEIPIRVVQWEIEDNGFFDVESGEQAQSPVQTFPKLHTCWVARISRKCQQTGSNRSNKMPLVVRYQCLDDQILSVIEEQFRTNLVSGPFTFASALLCRHLIGQIPSLWTESELETIALLREIRMWSYEDLEWKEVLRALSSKERPGAEMWLREWHHKHEYINLPSSTTPTRVLGLVVDVPQPALVIAVQLRLQRVSHGTIVAGQPVQADVIISCVANSQEELMIDYEVDGQIETWLVGGRKRGALHASSKKTKCAILLIAQRTGHLLLPAVDVRVRRSTDADCSPAPTFEVEHRSQAESVLVIPAFQTTTIALGADPASGSYALTERRRIQHHAG